jgi:hypothetical protein
MGEANSKSDRRAQRLCERSVRERTMARDQLKGFVSLAAGPFGSRPDWGAIARTDPQLTKQRPANDANGGRGEECERASLFEGADQNLDPDRRQEREHRAKQHDRRGNRPYGPSWKAAHAVAAVDNDRFCVASLRSTTRPAASSWSAGRPFRHRLTSRLRPYLRTRPKRATQEPVDHANSPEGEYGAKRNGYLHDKPRLRRLGWKTVHRGPIIRTRREDIS